MISAMSGVGYDGDLPLHDVEMLMLMADVQMTPADGFCLFFSPFTVTFIWVPAIPRGGLSRSASTFTPGSPRLFITSKKSLFILQKFIECGHKHVAGRPHITFDI